MLTAQTVTSVPCKRATRPSTVSAVPMLTRTVIPTRRTHGPWMKEPTHFPVTTRSGETQIWTDSVTIQHPPKWPTSAR